MAILLKRYLSLFLFPATLLFLQSCHNSAPTAKEAAVIRTPVTIAPVAFKPVTSSVRLPAIATYMNKSVVRATTAGIIDKVLVNPGELVNSDQLLFTIRTREAMAVGNKMAEDSSLSFKGIINIISHKDGVINSISYQKGDFVQEGDEMAVVSEQKSLVFILDVPFEFNQYIEKNRNCTIILPDNGQINGTITGKLPEMDMQSQTIRYVVRPVKTDRLPANLIASINIVKSTNSNALVLPKAAILGDETQTKFWVMKLINDSTAIKVDVQKGFENNDEVEITEPVFEITDRILLTGNYGLPDTARVTIIQK
jgi:multidrug efflux pump subunit AcrA (membrane-fusion protein)